MQYIKALGPVVMCNVTVVTLYCEKVKANSQGYIFWYTSEKVFPYLRYTCLKSSTSKVMANFIYDKKTIFPWSQILQRQQYDLGPYCLLYNCLFGSILNIPLNSYGHVGMVSSPITTLFSLASLTKGGEWP